jgi:hypothetical protein
MYAFFILQIIVYQIVITIRLLIDYRLDIIVDDIF